MRFTTRPIPSLDDPLALAPDTVWMSPDVSLWGWGEATRLHPGLGSARITAVRKDWSRLVDGAEIVDPIGRPGSGPVVFASVTFAGGSDGSVGIVPEVLVARSGDDWWMTAVDGAELPTIRAGTGPPSDRARYAGSSVPDVKWLEAVAVAVDRIESGILEKVVLARDYAVWSREPFHPPGLLRHLYDRFPGCHVFRVADLVGASPELLVRRRHSRFESLVLAGSAPSFSDPQADRAAATALLESKKDQWEHELAVRSVRESLTATEVDADFENHPDVLRLDNVQHLATRVTGRIPPQIDVLSLVDALHPTAAVGGNPTDDALELIDELEGMDRGRYAGPVGWTDSRGDGEFAIALRCAELSGARARLFAGAGIVTGSLPEAELEETRLKLQAMMGALEADS